jgi:hypothetical protein
MTVKEFQEKYHEYQVDNEMEARIEAMKLKVTDKDGNNESVVAVKIGDKWCLMLSSAAKMVEMLGIV